jgi:phosphatidate cytidylyltransferase
MALHWPTFFTRLGSAIVFCIVMMAGLLLHRWGFLALVALIQALCLRDYFRLIQKIYPEAKWTKGLPVAVQVIALVILVLLQMYHETSAAPVMLSFWPIIAALPLLLQKNKFAADARLQALAGMLYIAMPMEALLLLGQKHMMPPVFPLALILMIWTNDTMAYLVGSFIGKTPFSKISPKKTWEGTIGGAVLTIIGAGIFGYYTQLPYGMGVWMALALCAAVAGTIGDLFESKLKRMANVKDSGAMMPGHGGALDRFDSLLFAAPFACLLVYLMV